MVKQIDCPIWGKGHRAELYGYGTGVEGKIVIDDEVRIVSPRAGGEYRLLNESLFNYALNSLHIESKARLTTWLVDKRKRGEKAPVIKFDALLHFQETSFRHDLPVIERAERLLSFLVGKTKKAGDLIVVSGNILEESLAWSESTTDDELMYLFRYLLKRELIHDFSFSRKDEGFITTSVSVEGHEFTREIAINPDSRQAFVAMWFDPEMKDAYEQGIEPAITKAGYNPLRIDLKRKVVKIDDEIFAEIRRSRFLVADMTQGDDGARGGVYFEAGFTQGLGIPVLYSCRKDKMKHLSFDTRQFYHVEWKTPDELREQLATRILAILGEGPVLAHKE